MNLEIGKFYKIVISVNNNVLTYTCKITAISDTFVSFIDKFDKEYTYNLNNVVSFEERADD